jgi:ATP-dependent DNA helicase RecG
MRDKKKTTPQVTPQVIKLLKVCQDEMSRSEIQSKLNLKDREYLRKAYLKPALKTGFIELTIPDKPNSKNQKYRITEKGNIFLKTRVKQHE